MGRAGDAVPSFVQDFMLAKATYEAALKRWPKDRIRLCQEARIVEDSAER